MKKKNENSFLTDQDATKTVTNHSNSVSEIFKNDNDPETVRKKNWIAFLILIIGLVLTAVAVFYVQRDVKENARQDFASICDEINLKISARLHAHALLLRNGSAFFKASNNVSRKEWKVYNEAAKIDYNLPGIQGMGFSLIIPKTKLSEHIKNIRKEGFPNYTVYPAGDRAVYTSIIYLEPFEGRNLRAFGYDMFSEPVRRKAMEQSRDNDLAKLSGKVLLVQETKEDIQPGTLMYVPVYRNGMPVNTVEQRRAAILGWVYSPYRMTDLMKGILDSSGLIEKEKINLKVYDDSISANSLLYDSQKNDSLKNNNSHYLSLTMPVDFHGKKWVLFFTQQEDQLSIFQSKVIFVLLSGILLSLLLFLLSLSLINTRRRALQIADRLTVELKENAEQYKSLSDLLESIIDHIPGLLFYKDKKNNYIRVNKYIAQAHRKPKSEIEGKNLNELYSKEDAEKYYQDDLEVINSGISKLNIEEEWKTEDGLKWISTSKIPFVNDAGEIIGIIGISLDITERKYADMKLRESEERFSAAFHASPNLISITRLSDGMIMEVNEGYTQLLGYSRAESIGKNTKDLSIWFDPADREMFIATLEKSGRVNNFETKLRCKDGSVVTVLDSAQIIKLQDDTCILSIIYDITDRIRAEEIIRNAGLYNRSLIEASIDPLVTIGPDGKITDVNKATEDVTGICREQLIGSDFSDYFTEPQQAENGYKQALADGFVKDYPLTIRHADGKTTDVLYNATVYKNQQGEVVGVFAAARDVTKLKQEENIQMARSRLLLFANKHSIDEMLEEALNEMEKITESNIGFCHFVNSDQNSLTLKNWSTRTKKEFCKAAGKDSHYEIEKAGVWVDCFYQQKPVIHNDYDSLPHKKGMPDGHAKVIRELTVPIMRQDKVVAILGIGNKATDYTEKDVEALSNLADLFWNIIERKQAEDIIQNANSYNRSLIEASIDPLVTIGPDGKITDVNKATEEVTGILREQLIGSDFSDYFIEPQQANNGYKQVLEKGSVKDYPLTIRHANGKTTDVLYNATVYKNADGKVAGVFAAARDITETKKNEEALVKSESNLRAIFENTAKGFLLMDDTFTVIEFNSLMEKYITISDNIVLRKNENIFNNIPVERQEFLRTQFNTALDGEKVHYEISYLFSGNTTIYFEVKMYPVLDPEEKVAGICISYEDITARKLTEEQIIELNKDLDKKVQERTLQYELVNQELESFTFSVSHDLRAPLRAVNSYAQILEEDYSDRLDEDGKKMLKHIENNGKKMGRLIDDLLAFSRLGRKELKRVDVNMNDLTKAVVEELNQTFPNQASIEIADLPVVQGDYSLLYQAMLNLVSNAIKYSSKKDKPVIKIFTEQKDGKAIFTIKDNGAGFDMRFAEKLFGVFQRLHSEEEFEGSGIGLAIVHRIIAKHGGEVWGEGKVNEGATFHFKLN